MSLSPHLIKKAQAVLAASEADFAELAKIAGLDPKRDYVGANLRDVIFKTDDLSAFDFCEADLVGANLSQVKGVTFKTIDGVSFDATTQFPESLGWIKALTSFWRDGCPRFVSRFGFDEHGQWFEFEIAGPGGAVTQRMRWIAPGNFWMGSPETEADRAASEGPRHAVSFAKGFWLFDTVCTQALWRAVMGNDPSFIKGEVRPVESVSWEQAQAFVEETNRLVPGVALALPSEAQWEYACRAGRTTPFGFGENIGPHQVNYHSDRPYGVAAKGIPRRETVAVASLPANDWGLYEMHGNVWEWCADVWHDDYEGAPHDGSVWEEGVAGNRVVRGGSWDDDARDVRSAVRISGRLRVAYNTTGFRCARVQDGAEPAKTRRVERSGAQPTAAASSGGAERAEFSVNSHGVEIFAPGAPLVLRGAGARRRTKPAWADAIGRDPFGDWTEIAVGAARQRLRWIPPGKFWMGSPESEAGRWKAEGPRHEVTIANGYWLFDTPCTQALWRAVMGKNPSRFQGDDRPVEQVSWDDAQNFLKRLNKRIAGLDLSLPSEAQWEYACRAGNAGMSYVGDFEIPGENNAPGLDPIAWYGGNSGKDFDLGDGYDSSEWPEKQYEHKMAGTRPVKRKQANGYGLHDMLGNVWEWCADAWHRNYDGAPNDGSAWDDAKAAARVLRGGSWSNGAQFVRSAFRFADAPGGRGDSIGFRCARVQDGAEPAKTRRVERSGAQPTAAASSGGAERVK